MVFCVIKSTSHTYYGARAGGSYGGGGGGGRGQDRPPNPIADNLSATFVV